MRHGKGMTAHDKVVWTEFGHEAFSSLQVALKLAPTLGLADMTMHFVQTVNAKGDYMTSVMSQDWGWGD